MSDFVDAPHGLSNLRLPLHGSEPTAPTIYQFWHDPKPPAYILELIGSWTTKCPEFHHRLFDDASAREFIRENFGERWDNAYVSCRLPAMRADLLRLCVLYLKGGVYVDADQSCLASIHHLYQSCNRGGLHVRLYLSLGIMAILNGFMIVKRAMDPLLGKSLDVALTNIENRISNNVWDVTGPGIINDFWENGDPALFDGFNFLNERQVRRLMSFHPQLPYKQEGSYWLRIQRIETIFIGDDLAARSRQDAGSQGDGRAGTTVGSCPSVLDGIDLLLPALARAAEVSRCAASVGLEDPGPRALVARILEDAAKLGEERDLAVLEEQIGDLLFAITNLANKLQIEPEGALRNATKAFERHFRRLEAQVAARSTSELQ